MARHDPLRSRRQFLVDDMEIGTANAAGQNAYDRLARARLRQRKLLDDETPAHAAPVYGSPHRAAIAIMYATSSEKMPL
jgi:hypothetical protein